MNKEEGFQIAVANYLRFQYPNVLFTHVANERKTNLRRGKILKDMGLKAGIPDLLIFENKSHFSGLAIELKVPPNKPTKSQKEVMKSLSERGWDVHVCNNFQEAQQAIDNFLNL